MARKYIQNCTGRDFAGAKTNETSKKVLRIIFYVLTVFFLGAAIYLLFFSGQMQINNIVVTGTQELNGQEIQRQVQDSLQGKYLKFIPKNNFLFVVRGSLENLLLNDYKKIRGVTVSKTFPDTITINIDERQGLLVWCRGDNDCFLLDENGIAYSVADFNSPELTQNHLLQITDTSGAAVAIGDQVMDSDFEKYFLSIKNGVKSLGLDVADQYYTPSRMSQEIQVKSTPGFDLYFSTQFPLDSAIGSLGIFLEKGITADQLSNIAYIDLRTENKIFYKLNGADTAMSSTDAQPSASTPSVQGATDGTSSKSSGSKKK